MKLIDILLVEDNPGDIDLVREALDANKMTNNLYVAEDGEKAFRFLMRQGEFKNAPKPDLILLDLNLPKKDGRELLGDIKNNDDLKSIPVVILTSSKAEEDIAKSYQLHANCYITKPLDFKRFHEIVGSIKQFWFGIVELPKE